MVRPVIGIETAAPVYVPLATGEPFEPDFAHAVQRHTLLAAIERSTAEGRAVRL